MALDRNDSIDNNDKNYQFFKKNLQGYFILYKQDLCKQKTKTEQVCLGVFFIKINSNKFHLKFFSSNFVSYIMIAVNY